MKENSKGVVSTYAVETTPCIRPYCGSKANLIINITARTYTSG
jgi:hypothetical protein